MSYSWDHPENPVFSRVLKRRRQRQIVAALVVLAFAVVVGLLAMDTRPASSPTASTVSAHKAPTDAAPAASSATTPAGESETPSVPTVAAQPGDGSTTAPAAAAATPTPQPSSTDIIREPVLEGPATSPSVASAGTGGTPGPATPGAANATGGRPDVAVQAATEVRQALQAWAEAWSRRDFAAYTAAYTPSFKGSLTSRDAWLTQRRERILTRQRIEVVLTDVVIAVDGARARVDFRQLYASDNWRDDTRRTIDMQRTSEGWRIAGESNR